MGFSRKFLKALGIEEDKIEQIIDAHTDVTDALKKDRDKYKEDAEQLPRVKSELDEANKKLKDADSDGYKEKYEKEHKAFEAYKKDIDAEKTNEKKSAAYKALLKEAKVSKDWIDDIVKFTKLDDIALDDEGKIKDADERMKGIKEKYAKYIVKEEEQGAGTETPPSGNGNSGKTLSRAAQVIAKQNEMLYGVKGENK